MEFLEDTEKRILLSAISREKKVCERVDRESCREPHKTILTDICKSLEHKFMYDRLFKKIYQQGKADGIDKYSNELFTVIERCTVNCKLDLNIDDLHNLEIIIKGLAEQIKEQKE